MGYFVFCVLFFLLSCTSPKEYEKTIFVDNVDPADYKISEDRKKFEELRKNVPSDLKKENDETAYLLNLMRTDRKTDPSEIRAKFHSAVRKIREKFSNALRKEQADFQKLQRSQRMQFQDSQNAARKDAKSIATSKRNDVYKTLETERRDFNEKAKSESDVYFERRREKQKEFDEYSKELQSQFNFEMREYVRLNQEQKKSESLSKKYPEIHEIPESVRSSPNGSITSPLDERAREQSVPLNQ